MNVILSLQNSDGGWATYENKRGPDWVEWFNPAEVFCKLAVHFFSVHVPVPHLYLYLPVAVPVRTLAYVVDGAADGIMVDYSYVELTSSAMKGLAEFHKRYPNHRAQEIKYSLSPSFLRKTKKKKLLLERRREHWRRRS